VITLGTQSFSILQAILKTLIYANRVVIRAAAYINTNWHEQPMWTCEKGHSPVGYWGNARVQDSELIRDSWEQELSKTIWVQ